MTRDTVLIMLEAMKMELPIKAPRDGRVMAIACRPGELVQPGVPLIEFESDPGGSEDPPLPKLRERS